MKNHLLNIGIFPSPPGFGLRNPKKSGSAATLTAFSLIEVTLSIAIVAFAFVAIFGLLPVGMNTFRRAVDYSLGSQIVQRLVNDAMQTDYAELIKVTPAAPSTRYFDDQGNEVTADNDYLYIAELSVVAPTTLPPATNPASPSLATVTVRLANNPAHKPSPFDPASGVPVATYTAMIARNL